MPWVNAPICDECWFEANPDRQPHRLRDHVRENEQCFKCHSWTRSGIYVRHEIPS